MANTILDLNSDRSPDQAVIDDDLRLAEALALGTELAYETLIARFQQPVYALAMRLVTDQGDAGDVVQEVFLKVFKNIHRFRGQSSLRTWIYRITVNEAHNQRRWFFRHRSKEVGLDDDSEDSRSLSDVIADRGRSPYDVALDSEKYALIQEALTRINPDFREAVVLRDITGLSYEEIADVLAVSLGTVKSRILRGREALRRELVGILQPSPSIQWMPKTAE